MPGRDYDRYIRGWRGPALAALVALIAGLPGLLLIPVIDRQEARVAEATAQMLDSGRITGAGVPPEAGRPTGPGVHWLQGLVVSLGGEPAVRTILPYRLPSLLAAMLAAAGCAWGLRRLYGQRAGFLAGALLGATFLLSSEAGIAKADALNCAAVTLMMAAMGRMYATGREGLPVGRATKLLFWAGLAGSLLVGGLTGLGVAVLTAITLAIWERRIGWLGRIGWGWGLPLVAISVGPWVVAETIATDGQIWRSLLAETPVARLAAGADEAWRPGLHLLLAPLLLFPITLMFPAALMTAGTRHAEPGVRFAVAWLVPAWIVLELTPDPHWHQPLPLYGAIAWLAAIALTRPLGRVSRLAGVGLALVTGLLVLGAALFGLSEYGGDASQAWATPAIGLTLAAAFIGGFLLYHRMGVTALLLSIGLGVLAHGSLAGVAGALRPLWVSPRLVAELRETGLHPVLGRFPAPVAVAGYDQPSVRFLLGRAGETTDGAGAALALSQGRPAVVDRREESAFRDALAERGGLAEAVAEIEGVNYSNGDRVDLTLYAPERMAPR